MKLTFRKIAAPLVSVALLSTATAANAGFWNFFFTDTAEQPTITDLVSRSGGVFDGNDRDYDILLTAVTTAGLGDALADRSANLTLLAPDDDAFITLAQDLGYLGDDEAGAFDAIVAALTDLGNGDPIPVLTNVLLYHVIPANSRVRDIVYEDSIATLLTDATITPDRLRLADNEPDVKDPKFIYPVNRRAANGYIHTINRVLLPIDVPGNTAVPAGSIADIVTASGGVFDRNPDDFDILLTAVQAAGLAGALADEAADLTVFAPDDYAFYRLARDLGYRGNTEQGVYDAIVASLTTLGNGDPIPLLTDILLYHVSPGAKTFKQVTDAASVDTLLADASFTSFGIYLIDNAPQLRAPRLVSSDGGSNIQATNGVVHTINRVLVPLDVAPVRGNKH